MTHEIFSAPMLLTENVIDKAGLGIEVSSFSQIRVFSSGLGLWWWAAAFVYKVDRCRPHLNHGIQGWVLNSGSEWAPWQCLDYVWRGDMEAHLHPRALREPWLPWAMGQGWICGALQEVPWEQLGNHSVHFSHEAALPCCFGAWGMRKYHFCILSFLYCFDTWSVLTFFKPIQNSSQISIRDPWAIYALEKLGSVSRSKT